MKKQIRYIFLFTFYFISIYHQNCFSQAPEIDLQYDFGGSSSETLDAFNTTIDGGFILGVTSSSSISGNKFESGIGGTDYWVIKTDSNMNIQWQNTIGGSGDDYISEVFEIPAGGYFVAGYSGSGISGDKSEAKKGNYDYWIMKLNSSGGIVWQNTIQGKSDDYLYAADLCSDGNVFIAGYSNSIIGFDKTEGLMGTNDIWLLKIDIATGAILWQQTLGGNADDLTLSLAASPDGGCIVGGSSASGISGDKTEAHIGGGDFWIIKLSSTGSISWQNTIGGSLEDKPYCIKACSGGGYIVGGNSDSGISGDKTEAALDTNPFDYDYWVVRLDDTGNILWQNTIGGNLNDQLRDIEETADGGFLLGGRSNSGISGDKTEAALGFSDYWLVKINSTGTVVWDNTYKGNSTDFCREIEIKNVDIFLGGYSISGIGADKTIATYGAEDVWMLKLIDACLTYTEICNGLDDNCNGLTDDEDSTIVGQPTWYADEDADGYGNILFDSVSCFSPLGYVMDSTDCNDLYDFAYPGAAEIFNGVDDDCNGYVDDLIPIIEWENTIGGTDNDELSYLEPTSDGGFILGGTSNSYIDGDKTAPNWSYWLLPGYDDYWIVKLDEDGIIEWQKTYGGYQDDQLKVIHQLPDGGYIVGGYSESDNTGNKTTPKYGDDSYEGDYWVLRLNSSGDCIWQKTIGGSGTDRLEDIALSPDGGFIIGGYSNSDISFLKSENSIINDYWVIKLNSAGDIEWEQTYSGNSSETLRTILTLSDGYLLGGISNSDAGLDKTENSFESDDIWLIKIDFSGNIIWDQTIGGNQSDGISKICEIPTGFVISGQSSSDISGDKSEISTELDCWIIELDILGNIIWDQTIGGESIDFAEFINKTETGFLISGNSYSDISRDKIDDGFGSRDYWIFELNGDGSIKWQKTIGGSDLEGVVAGFKLSDGSIIAGGNSESNISGNKTENNIGESDFWIVKLAAVCGYTPELCNTLDDNCNGLIDDGVVETISISAGGPTTFCQGGSVVLSATYSGATVQWKKDGVNIAGATTANYTVTKKGNYTCVTTSPCGTATSSIINVVVNKNPNASISAGGATTFCAGGSVTLTEIASPGCTYQWYKGASSIAGATSTNYIATTTGNYKCRVTKTATGCYKNSNAISVSVPCREDEMNSLENNSFTLFPNPANDKLNIQIESNLLSPSSFLLTITDLEGREIYTTQLNSPTAEINISDFASGMYFVKVNFDGE